MRAKAAALLLLLPVFAAAATPPVGQERIVLHTLAGDLVLGLYPSVAPRHVEQILRLVRMGVYDTTHFYRAEPGFLVQLSDAADRTIPLSPQQRSLISPIKAEISRAKHVRGSLTMAHQDNDPDSAETSFSILLADAPHLDGNYTVFGELESGFEVLDEFLRVPRNADNVPLVRLEVFKAEVVDTPLAMMEMHLAPARPIPLPATLPAEQAAPGELEIPSSIAFGVLLMMVLDLLGYAAMGRLPARAIASLYLLNVLAGGFLVFVILTPAGHRSPALACALFLGLLGLIKLMGKLEAPA